MNFLLSLLWLPVAPLVFAGIQVPSPAGLLAAGVCGGVAASLVAARRRRNPTALRVAKAAVAVYLLLAGLLVGLDLLPGPGLRSAVPPTTLHALPSAPGWDFENHPNPVLHVLATGERGERPAGTLWSGGRGTAALEGALFVLDHPTYGLVIYETSTGHEADVSGLLHSAGLDPSRVRSIVAAGFADGPGVAARGLPDAWILADADEPRPPGVAPARIQPIRFDENPGFGPFDHYFDLTGDGSILLLSSPGPSPGHVALFGRLRGGLVLLAGDIAPVEDNLSSASTPLPPRPAHSRQLGNVLWMADNRNELAVLPSRDLGALAGLGRPDITLHPPPGAP